MYSLGIDLGGTNIVASVVDDHKILRSVAATGKRLTQCGAVGVILYKYIVDPQALPKHFPGRQITYA